MTTELELVRARIGMESPPIGYDIDAGSVRFFVDALMDSDRVYRGDAAARASGLSGVVAPAVFFGSAVGLKNVAAGDRRTMFWNNVLLPEGWFSMATGDVFHFYAPVRPAMSLVARETLVDAYEKTGRNGRLIFFTYEKVFEAHDGSPVMRRLIKCAARAPAPASATAPPRRTSDLLADGGVPIPPLTVGPVTVRYLAMFATATAEYVDIHYDADYARSVGLPGPIIQGLYKTALIGQMLARWGGYEHIVRQLDVQHRGMDLAGSMLTARGCITSDSDEVSGDGISCRVWVENQDGVVTTEGKAVVRPNRTECD
ncbi:MAG: MaoC family dehydratase N-terminal domain-containing protein [Dehalococcoidia bacterium]|nr:MaoC family dehydratase N-terminal domain-containing protein [Dehalococcoidia bacterium]